MHYVQLCIWTAIKRERHKETKEMNNPIGNFRCVMLIFIRTDLDNSHDVYVLMTQLARSSFVYISRFNFEKKPNTVFLIAFEGSYVMRTTQIKETGTSISCMRLLMHVRTAPKSTIEKPFRRKICPFDVLLSFKIICTQGTWPVFHRLVSQSILHYY